MTTVFVLTLITFAGLVVALARPRSLVARLTSIGLAVLMGGFGLLMIVAAHRLAEEEPPEASSRSAGFQLGVERMRTIVSLPLPLLLAAGYRPRDPCSRSV